VYFFRKGSGSGANIWTVYLEGGGWCYDTASCASRNVSTPHFMTSKLLPAVLNDNTVSRDVNHGGINSASATVNPHFYNANQVYVWYCSSDSHIGNRSASASTAGWNFKGKVIVSTVIEDLYARNKDSFNAAEHFLLLGFSAGALGALHNADFVGGIVKSYNPKVNYRTYVDSGWLFDAPPYDAALSNRDVVQKMHSNFYTVFNENCVKIFQASGEDVWRCGLPVHIYPHVATPLVFAGYLYDSPFLGVSPANATSQEYVAVLRKTFLMDTTPLRALFAPNCYNHGVVAYDNRWNVITVQGITASDLVWKWLSGDPSAQIRAVDSCAGIACNPTCPK
jgi:hypothetical protein